METVFGILESINAVTLSVPVLLVLLAVGVLFTVWSGFLQYRALTHGFGLLTGRWTAPGGPGVLSHFSALSAALAATVGLGNIAGVAIAVEIGGPGAVFWMWVVGFVGMAIKSTEVLLAVLYRDVSDPANPHGGTMWVAKRGLAELSPRLARTGTVVGGAFSVALLTYAFFAGNMFQSWSVGDTTREYFGVAPWLTGLILAAAVGVVIIGGIRRIGALAARLVPVMGSIYVLAGLWVLYMNADELPGTFALILTSAFSSADAGGAFLGAGLATAFIFGMKRALFSSEAGLGSAPIAHSAVRTREPVTEGIVAGLEPCIDTLVVCTVTALVILVSGVWDRGPSAAWEEPPAFEQTDSGWIPDTDAPPAWEDGGWHAGDSVFVVIAGDDGRERLYGRIEPGNTGPRIQWTPLPLDGEPRLVEDGLFADYTASTLTAKAFDSAADGLGQWMVTITIWLFAISTMITWSYYGEQAITYLFGQRWIPPYRAVYCGLIVLACTGLIQTTRELDTLSTVGVGLMLIINLPLMVILGHKAMGAYKEYIGRLERGDIHP